MILSKKAVPKMEGSAKDDCKAAIYAHAQVCTPAGLSKLVHHVKLIDTFRRPNEPAMTRIELGVHAQLEPIVNILGLGFAYGKQKMMPNDAKMNTAGWGIHG